MVPAGFGAGEQHLFEQHKQVLTTDSMMHNAGVKMAQFTQLFTGGTRSSAPVSSIEQPHGVASRAPPLAPSSSLARRGSGSVLASSTTAEPASQAFSLAAFSSQTGIASQRSIGREGSGSIGRSQGSGLRPGGRASSDAAVAPSFSLAAFSQGQDPHTPASHANDVASTGTDEHRVIAGVGSPGPSTAASGAKVQVGWNRLVAGFKEVGKGLIE
jgi:hypothetical protein